MSEGDAKFLLGGDTPNPQAYAPELLYPIPRAAGRASLQAKALASMYGSDIWHAYELSWLTKEGVPRAAVGKLIVPSDSPNIVESKSLKLYLNSLNYTTFESDQDFASTVEKDVAATAGSFVQLQLFAVGSEQLAGSELLGECLDDLSPASGFTSPDAAILEVASSGMEEQICYSHLMRSLCPVTRQPDWATIWIRRVGPKIAAESLLGYILSFRDHQEFHEQCIERMYVKLMEDSPEQLEIQGFYTRRGGLDINPFRSNLQQAVPQGRLNRQ